MVEAKSENRKDTWFGHGWPEDSAGKTDFMTLFVLALLPSLCNLSPVLWSKGFLGRQALCELKHIGGVVDESW